MLAKAIQTATVAHAGQTNKSGRTEYSTPLRITATGGITTEDQRICAVLYDVEDTDGWFYDGGLAELDEDGNPIRS